MLPARAHANEWIYATNTYGYAGATFDWTGRGRVSNIDLYVSDWECDGQGVYAYFKVIYTDWTYNYTDTKRWDHSGCDTQDYSTYNDLKIEEGFDILYLQVIMCRRDGPCKAGNLSGENPYVRGR